MIGQKPDWNAAGINHFRLQPLISLPACTARNLATEVSPSVAQLCFPAAAVLLQPPGHSILADEALRLTKPVLFSWSRMLDAAFHSPAPIPPLRVSPWQGHHSRPAPSLPLQPSFRPFGFRTPGLPQRCGFEGPIVTRLPVPELRTATLTLSSRFLSPPAPTRFTLLANPSGS